MRWVREQVERHRAGALVPQDPGPMAPHTHEGVVHVHRPGDGSHEHPGPAVGGTRSGSW